MGYKKPSNGINEDKYKLSIYPEIRSKSSLAPQPMSITGMTLKLPADQRERGGERGSMDRGVSPENLSSVHASNEVADEPLAAHIYYPVQYDYGNQYFNPHTTQGTFIAGIDPIDEEQIDPRQEGQEMEPTPSDPIASRMLQYQPKHSYLSP